MKVLKIIRKILSLLPVLAIGLVILLAFITFCLGLGDVVRVYYTDCLSGGSCVHSSSEISTYSLEWYAPEELAIGNAFSILGFVILLVSLVFSILNIPNKTAKGPWLLLAGIVTYVVRFFFMVRPILLQDIRTTDIGDVWEVFNWVTFAFASIIWWNCIILFILNKTLFKKVLVEQQ